MVSQFISSHKVELLGDLSFHFPEGTHAIGRLDINSEGLLILTTNKRVTRLLFQGELPHKRRYLVQVKNILNNDSLERLQSGVSIRINTTEYYTTPPCEVSIVDDPQKVYPFAVHKTEFGENTWLLITLMEGKYRQVRKMMMAINHRCKRLIRVSIEELALGNLEPGHVQEIAEADFFEKLNIKYKK